MKYDNHHYVWQSLKLPFLKEWLVFTQYITLLSLSHKWGIFIYLLIHVGTFIFVVEFVESVAKENSRPINWIEIVLIIWPDYFLDHIKIAELGTRDQVVQVPHMICVCTIVLCTSTTKSFHWNYFKMLVQSLDFSTQLVL